MSIDYSLKIEAPLNARQALSLLVDRLGLTWSGTNSVVGEGLWVGARDITSSDDPARSDFKADYGFQPATSVNFQVQENGKRGSTYEELYKTAHDQLGRAVAVLLSHSTGDAVMLANYEYVVLQKANGKLILNEGWAEEIMPHLDSAGLRYKVRCLRSPRVDEPVPVAA